MVRRLVPLALSLGLALTLGVLRTGSALAQETKKDRLRPRPKPPSKSLRRRRKPRLNRPRRRRPPRRQSREKAAETPAPTIPKDVEEKLEKARHAVAEAIVAAQDAGLVDTSIDPPPILDILIKGYAFDAKTLKNPAAKKTYWAVSPEVFCGWFTGYGKQPEGVTINPQADIRIINPSAGLKAWYDQRANFLNKHIEEVRKAKGQTAAPSRPRPSPRRQRKKSPSRPRPSPPPSQGEEPPKAEVKKEEAKKK